MKRRWKSYFDIVVGLATIVSCGITWIGLNRGIHQIANNVSQLFYEIKPVVEKFQEPQLPLRDTIVIIQRDTVIIQQQVPEKESSYNLPKNVREDIDSAKREIEKRNGF